MLINWKSEISKVQIEGDCFVKWYNKRSSMNSFLDPYSCIPLHFCPKLKNSEKLRWLNLKCSVLRKSLAQTSGEIKMIALHFSVKNQNKKKIAAVAFRENYWQFKFHYEKNSAYPNPCYTTARFSWSTKFKWRCLFRRYAW